MRDHMQLNLMNEKIRKKASQHQVFKFKTNAQKFIINFKVDKVPEEKPQEEKVEQTGMLNLFKHYLEACIMRLNLMTNKLRNKDSQHQVFKFKTNAQKFKTEFKAENEHPGNYPHVGISAQEGIMVLYRKCVDSDDSSTERTWYNVESYTERYDSTVYMHHLVRPQEDYEVLIYGPIINNLSQMEIESPDGTYLETLDTPYDKKLLVAGGLISHGLGCTTSAICFPNILGRKLNASVDYITYSDGTYLDKVHEYLNNTDISEVYDVGILELDYSNQNDEVVKEHLKDVIELMKTHCKHLICWSSIPGYKSYKKTVINDIVNEVKDDNISLADYSFIFNKENVDICTYSGNYINDSGNVMIYRKLEELIRGL